MNDEGTVTDFKRTRIVRVFNVVCAWNSVKAKTLPQAWRRLWPAVMIDESASGEEASWDLMFTTETRYMKLWSVLYSWTPQTPTVKYVR